ncbi:MAG TPA: hypothetical protein VGK02_02675 [Candidatus Aquicultor sp.]
MDEIDQQNLSELEIDDKYEEAQTTEPVRQHWLIKTLLIGSIFIISANLLLVSILMRNAKPDPQPLSPLVYERAFLDSYDKIATINENLLYLLNDDAAITNPALRQQVQVQVTSMKTVLNQTKQLMPPHEHEVADMSLKKAIRDYSWAMDNLITALVDQNAKLSQACLTKLTSGQQSLDLAVERIEQGL